MRGVSRIESVQPPIFVPDPLAIAPDLSVTQYEEMELQDLVVAGLSTLNDSHLGKLIVFGEDGTGKSTFISVLLQAIAETSDDTTHAIYIGRAEANIIAERFGGKSVADYLHAAARILDISIHDLIVITDDVAIASDISLAETGARLILEASVHMVEAIETMRQNGVTHTWSDWKSIRVDVAWETLSNLIDQVILFQKEDIFEEFQFEFERKDILRAVQTLVKVCSKHFGDTADRESVISIPAAIVGHAMRHVAQLSAMSGKTLTEMSAEEYADVFESARDTLQQNLYLAHELAERFEDDEDGDASQPATIRITDPSKQDEILAALQSGGLKGLLAGPLAQFVQTLGANGEPSDDDSAKAKSDEPAESMSFSPNNTLARRLKQTVIGQDKMIEAVVDAVAIPAAGMHNPDRPLRTFIFMGPTGVGKTALALQMAKEVGKEPMNVIRLDMSEYATPGSASAMYGSTPGYIGYDARGGALTRAVADNPNSLIILDEIEKAHESIWDSMLQVFDAGRMTTGAGNVVDFSNCIIVMTSNLGSAEMSKPALGFGDMAVSNNHHEIALSALGKYLKPEMINRIDEKLVFSRLDREAARKIVKREIEIIGDRIEAAGHKIKNATSKVLDELLALSKFDIYGAREIQRSVQKYIATPMAKEILSGGSESKTFKVAVSKGEIVIVETEK